MNLDNLQINPETGVGRDYINVFSIKSAILQLDGFQETQASFRDEPMKTYRERYARLGETIINPQNRERITELDNIVAKLNLKMSRGEFSLQDFSDLVNRANILIYASEAKIIDYTTWVSD